jgi:hypothetical protein
MRTLIRSAAVAAATGVLLLVGPGSAWAHECFVANRSVQGNAAVSEHSAAWQTITPEFLFSVIIPLPPTAQECAVAAWNANADLPPYVVVGGKQALGQGYVIAENNPNFASGKANDGKGIDHAEEAFDSAIGAILGQCLPPPT